MHFEIWLDKPEKSNASSWGVLAAGASGASRALGELLFCFFARIGLPEKHRELLAWIGGILAVVD
jgi:hypothetical protein